MQSHLLVSVVITTYNRSSALLAVLEGLAQQTDKNFEVVVADDGSSAAHTQQILQSPCAIALKAVHVWHPDIGFTASRIRNRGVAASHGSYLIFMDGDCIPEIDFIAQHRALAAPRCFLNGSRVLLSEAFTQRIIQSAESLTNRSSAFWIKEWLKGNSNKISGLWRLPDGAFRMDRGVAWTRIRSCNLAVWRSDFEAVDGFDESFVGWGHEDADFVLRLHHAGVLRKNGFCATEVFHLWHEDATRSQSSHNASTVIQRSLTQITLPTLGYGQHRSNDDAVITQLG